MTEPPVPVLRVVVARRHGLSQEPEEREVGWPGHWRLPVAGEQLRLDGGEGGPIVAVTWDLDRGVIVLALR